MDYKIDGAEEKRWKEIHCSLQQRLYGSAYGPRTTNKHEVYITFNAIFIGWFNLTIYHMNHRQSMCQDLDFPQ